MFTIPSHDVTISSGRTKQVRASPQRPSRNHDSEDLHSRPEQHSCAVVPPGGVGGRKSSWVQSRTTRASKECQSQSRTLWSGPWQVSKLRGLTQNKASEGGAPNGLKRAQCTHTAVHIMSACQLVRSL